MRFPVYIYFAFRRIAAYSEHCIAKAPIKPLWWAQHNVSK